jgi:acyl carrier protein
MADHKDMHEQIKQILADILDMPLEDIGDDTSMENTARWDSLNHINLVAALEQELDVSFDIDEIESMVSYLDILQVVQSKL